MPQGLVRSGDFRTGTPITLPHRFGNSVGAGEPFGNIEPQPNDTLFENQVTWAPNPTHFGNQVSFSLQTVPPVLVVAPNSAGTTDINLTNLLGSNSATLTYYGAPVGVTVAFGTNPDTGTSVATVTVGANVPAGRYTITVVGTVSGTNIETTNIQLVVTANPNPPTPAVGIQRVVTLISASALNNSSTVPVQILPAPGVGCRINIVNVLFQSTTGTTSSGTIYFNLGPPLSLTNNLPEFHVDGRFSLGIAEGYSSLYVNATAEAEGSNPLPVSWFNNQPYMLSLSQFTSATIALNVIAYYTIEPIH